MKTKESFKPMFLMHNADRFHKMEMKYSEKIRQLNDLVEEAEKALNRKLSDDEKHLISEGDSEFIFEELKDKQPFPKATDEFNYEAMGVDIAALKQKDDAFSPGGYEYSLKKDGTFKQSKEYLESMKSETDIYTTNERQNKALKAANKLYDAYTELLKLGVSTSPYLVNQKAEVSDFVTINSNLKLAINLQRIMTL